MSAYRLTRFCEAYVAMARKARYRPAAPGDGWGSVYLTRKQLADPEVLKQEAMNYALAFEKEDNARDFHLGCSNWSTNRALVWTVEAARQMCGGCDGNATALRLLKMAAKEVDCVMKGRDDE
jgi:hypothetical protein